MWGKKRAVVDRFLGLLRDTGGDPRRPKAVLLDQPEVETPAGLARRRQDGVHRETVEAEPVMWMPDGAKRLQARLIVGALIKGGRLPRT